MAHHGTILNNVDQKHPKKNAQAVCLPLKECCITAQIRHHLFGLRDQSALPDGENLNQLMGRIRSLRLGTQHPISYDALDRH